MSAPSADFPALGASTSSSGYTDGLGRRSLAFDREDGTMLERLVVRAELSAFERSLRERVERIAALDDERLARPRSIERGNDGALVVLSEFVPGSRLSDLLESTAQEGIVPGVDVALGYLLDILPALCGLHAGAGFAHGAITPGRTVLTPAGQVVLLDAIFGDALTRLQYSRRRLWVEFGVATPPAAGPPRFDAASDIAQAVLSAVMLVLGRAIGEEEYPDAIPSLLVEVVDVAQIRGSGDFAAGLQRFLQRALPLPGRRPYAAADDALIDARELVRTTIGVDVCRRALVEFLDQLDPGGSASASAEYAAEYAADNVTLVAEEDPFTAETAAPDDGDEMPLEMDLDLDDASSIDDDDTVYDLTTGGEAAQPEEAPAAAREPLLETPDADSLHAEAPLESLYEPAAPASDTFEAAVVDAPAFETPPIPELTQQAAISAETEATPSVAPEPSAPSAPIVEETTDEPATGWRRRKRSRSPRSRKDKLRSTARPPAPAPPVPPQPAPPAPPQPASTAPTPSGWLVRPDQAAKFEPPVPAPQAPPAPRVFAAPPPPPAPPVAPAPPPVPQAVAPPPPAPRSPAPAPPAVAPTAPIRLAPIAAAAPPSPTIKLKTEPPAGYAPPRKPRQTEDIYSPRFLMQPEQDPGGFPWKMAGAAVVVMVIAVAAGRAYLPDRSAPEPAVESAPAPAPAAAPPLAAPKTGRIQIETQPPGARVSLDGKPAGDSPVTLDVPPGRHTVTLASASGSVRRTVRVEPGKTVVIDIPIFSGWVDIFAPIILDVSEGGRSIGTTEQSRVLLRPGRHELTLSNRELGYTTTETVDIEPGESKTLTLDPRGTVNFNAIPWAEVWIDGHKAGDTPLANLRVPLGTREVLFKHPQFGERRVTITVKATAPAAVSVNMTKQ